MGQSIQEWIKVFCLGRPYHFKFSKGCLPQTLLGPFLNTLTQIKLKYCKKYEYAHLENWYIKWTIYERCYTETKFSTKNISSGKTVFFVIGGPFCTCRSICLNISFDRSASHRNIVLSMVVLSTKKRYSSFSEKVSVFQIVFNTGKLLVS